MNEKSPDTFRRNCAIVFAVLGGLLIAALVLLFLFAEAINPVFH
ncbi:MAG: hypothetical protein AAFW73_22025 [Bacteroidota bacterium]